MDFVDSIPPPFFTRRSAAASVSILLLAVSAFGEQTKTVSSFQDPVELVRKTVQNEIRSAKGADAAHFMFRGAKTTSRETTTRLYVETKEATAAVTIAYNGKPLTPDQRQAEEARIERFIDHPEELRKKREKEHEDSERTLRIMRALPDAFVFEYAGDQPAEPGLGRVGATLTKLKFHPNPNYQPPSHVEDVLTGMDGFVLIDCERFRLAAIDGTLFKEVGFGWGILGHLNTGGRFIVHQQEVGDNVWEISSMTLSFTGKILVFKNLYIDSTEIFSDFKQVPLNLTYSEALNLLKKEESSVTAENCCQPAQPSN
jgi:hypothetical protein